MNIKVICGLHPESRYQLNFKGLVLLLGIINNSAPLLLDSPFQHLRGLSGMRGMHLKRQIVHIAFTTGANCFCIHSWPTSVGTSQDPGTSYLFHHILLEVFFKKDYQVPPDTLPSLLAKLAPVIKEIKFLSWGVGWYHTLFFSGQSRWVTISKVILESVQVFKLEWEKEQVTSPWYSPAQRVRVFISIWANK